MVETKEAEAPRKRMGTLASLALGSVFGLAFMAAMAAMNFSRIAKKPQVQAGMEVLARGASEWRPLASPDGAPVTGFWQGKNAKLLVSTQKTPFGSWWNQGKWETTTELRPSFPNHPTTAEDVSWRWLGDGTWLTARAGTTAPVLEPAKTQLPEIPGVDREKFALHLVAATRLSDGSLLAVAQHEGTKFHAWRLAPGAAAWTDTGELPFVALFGRLVPGWDRKALLVGTGNDMALYDGERWTRLPLPKDERIGWDAALADDGAVLAAGGFPDTKKAEATTSLLVLSGFVVAGLVTWRLLGASLIAMVAGATIGVFAAIAAFFAFWIFVLGPRF